MPIPVAKTRSIVKYIDWALEFNDKLKDEHGRVEPWFRGVGSEGYSLVPSLFRTAEGREPYADETLRIEFMRKALPIAGDAKPRNDWEWYFLMQHYRVPTRLLDWSDGALISLYFALSSHKTGTKPAVWGMDPWALNGDRFQGPADIEWEGAQNYFPSGYEGMKRVPLKPVAIDPSFAAQRMLVQRAHFTLHGRDMRGLEQIFPAKAFRKIVIDLDDEGIENMLEELRVLGIAQTTIFPDLEGLAAELKFDYRIR